MFLISLILSLVHYSFIFIRDDYRYLDVNFAMGLYIGLSSFFFFFRRRNNLFCPELLFLLIYFIIIFFVDLIPNDDVLNRYIFMQWSDKVSNKSLCVGMIAFLALMIGEELCEKKFRIHKRIINNIEGGVFVKDISLTVISRIQLACNLLLIIIILDVIASKSFMSFFKYSSSSYIDMEQTVSIIRNVSVILSVYGVFEFIKLKKQNVILFIDFIKNVDKRYLSYISIIGVFFLVTGNRNESLFILFPPIILYSILIKPYNIKQILVGGFVGIFVMLLIGFTRQGNVSVGDAFQNRSALEYIRDYGSANVSQKGLIEYTDNHGCVGLTISTINFFNSFPFVGGLIKNIFGTQNFIRSSIVTTDNYQDMGNMYSGLGTSLIGDLYYSGSIYFVVLYMFVLGMLFSYFNIKITKIRRVNIYHLLIYLWLFSDMVYYLRAEWYTIIRYIVFSLFLTYLLKKYFSTLKNRI